MEMSEERLEEFFSFMTPLLDERQRRLMAGALANIFGRGGLTVVAKASGMSRNTVMDGSRQAHEGASPSKRVREEGGGRPRLSEIDPELVSVLSDLVESDSRGDPMSPLRWTLKSTRQLAGALVEMGHQISYRSVGNLLHTMGYSLQATAKTVEGIQHPDRGDQFIFINEKAKSFIAAHQPVISIDCKKKELVGKDPGYKNAGQEWRKGGDPRTAGVHDFPIKGVPKAIPYGVYDIGADDGWVSVGSDHDTAAFAVNAIRRWWNEMGKTRYPKAKRLLVTADAGGSNGYRSRLFKIELARLSAETGLTITVCHFPPGTSKWNKIEHRLFSFITMNWRGQQLTDYRTIVELIGATTSRTGLTVRAEWDETNYPLGTKISDEELAAVPMRPDEFHGEWNYVIGAIPRRSTSK